MTTSHPAPESASDRIDTRLQAFWPAPPEPLPRPTLRQRLAALWRAAGLLAFLTGPPTALIALVGWPLPRSWQHALAWFHQSPTSRMTTEWVINAGACVLWLLWALLAFAVIAEGVAALARIRLPRLRPFSALQGLAAGLVGTTVAGFAGSAAHAVAPAVTTTVADPAPHTGRLVIPAQRVPTAAATAPPTALLVSRTTATAAATRPQAPQAPPVVCAGRHTLVIKGDRYAYIVAKDQSLWVMAQLCLGDGTKWPDIWNLNRGRHFATVGGTLTNPNTIYPGWDLYLPSHAIPPPTARAPTPPAPPSPPQRQPTTPAAPIAPTSPSATATARVSPDSDGVVEPGLPSRPSTTSPTSAPARSSPPSHAPSDRASLDGDRDRGVSVPGGWVSIGLAAMLVAAAAMVWLRRQNRYSPDRTVAAADDPTLQPLPLVINRLRRSVREQAPELLAPPPPQPTVRELAGTEPPPLPPIGPSGPLLAGLREVPRGGLGVAGPAGPDAARAMLVATMSSGDPHDPDACGQVVIPASALAHLLGAAADAELLRTMPRLRITTGLNEALAWIEEQLIHRTRVVTDADVTDIAALHEADPHHEPLPPITLITDVPDTAIRARLSTAAHLGWPLSITAVVIGDWPAGTTVHVNADGCTTGDDNAQRLSVLDAPTALDLLTVLCEAHTGQPSRAPTETPSSPSDDIATVVDPPTQQHTQMTPAREASARPSSAGTTAYRVRVQILGGVAIYDSVGNPITGIRRAAYELLIYLAVHRHGADIADIEVAMTPDATRRRASERLATNVGNLRTSLKRAAGIEPDEQSAFKPVVNPGGRYYLVPELVEIDWWRVMDAAAQASSTADPDAQRGALEQAVEHWGGLLHDENYEWIDGPQHTCRQLGVNIHARLAALVADTDAPRAQELLETACDIDPMNEELAARAMQIHARLGDTQAIHRRLAALTAALRQIDERVSDNTHELANSLLRRMSPHSAANNGRVTRNDTTS